MLTRLLQATAMTLAIYLIMIFSHAPTQSTAFWSNSQWITTEHEWRHLLADILDFLLDSVQTEA